MPVEISSPEQDPRSQKLRTKPTKEETVAEAVPENPMLEYIKRSQFENKKMEKIQNCQQQEQIIIDLNQKL